MSMTEILLILFVALLLFGPEDLPVVARAVGKIVRQVRKFTTEITKEFQESINAPAPKTETKSKKNDDSEELLTYHSIKNGKPPEEQSKGDNPLESLPANLVSFPNDKRAGE